MYILQNQMFLIKSTLSLSLLTIYSELFLFQNLWKTTSYNAFSDFLSIQIEIINITAIQRTYIQRTVPKSKDVIYHVFP